MRESACEGESGALKSYKPEYNPEYMFLQFDENVLYEKDFQGLRDKAKIKEIMEKERLKYGKILQKCFSDSIFRIDAKGNKARRLLYITEFNVYIFDEKSLKVRNQMPLDALQSMVLLETSPILCCFKLADSYDYLFETFKRAELAEYLKEFANFQLEFAASFTVYFKGLKKPKKIEDLAKGVYVSGGKQSAYKISQKQGFLEFYSKKRLFSKDWQEVFVVLCEVGLILFEKPGELKPLLFVPIADAMVIKNPKNVDKPNAFKIQYSSSDIEFCFSAISAALLDQWNDMIHDVITTRLKAALKKNLAH